MEIGIVRGARVALAIVAGLAASSCDVPLMHHRQQARIFIPPPPPPKPAPVPVPQLPAPPETEMRVASLAPAIAFPVPFELPPPPPAPVKRPPVAPPKVQAGPTPEPPTVVPPKLGQIFTPEQARQYNQALQESFTRVDSALAKLEGKRLTAEQVETADRIRTFRRQAEQAREQDLVTAVSLARRADLLAKDLLGRLP